MRKFPPSLSLFAALFAGLTGAILQPGVMATFIGAQGGLGPIEAIKATWAAMAGGFSSSTGIPDIDRLLSRGGMDSMLFTLWLIIGAVTLGALLDELGFIRRLVEPLIVRAKTRGRLYLAVFASAFGLNIVAGDQYIALVLPARTYRAESTSAGSRRRTSPGSAPTAGRSPPPSCPGTRVVLFMGSTLGVSTLLYLPFCFFNLFSPLLSVVYGFTGFKIVKTEPVLEEEAPT